MRRAYWPCVAMGATFLVALAGALGYALFNAVDTIAGY